MRSASSDRLSSISFIKTVLMICVIMGHSVNFWNGNWFTIVSPIYDSKVLCFASEFLNSFHVTAFTLISGYLFYYLKIEQERYPVYSSYLLNKTKRLIVPFYFVSVIWVIPIAVLFFHYSVKEVVLRYLLGISPNQLWFLLMLFWVYVIVWPLASLLDRMPILGAGIVGLLYVVGMLGSRFVQNYFYIWGGCEYVLFFWIGYIIRKYTDLFVKIKWYIWLGAYIVTFIVWTSLDVSVWRSLLEIVVHVIGAIASFESLGALSRIIDWDKKWFGELSKRTMPMYLFHQQFVYFTIVLLNGKVHPIIHALINMFVASVGNYLISTVFMKWSVSRFLIGEK
ncbi:MAG: acyltransferase [Oscillospiraceae bacterium]|nr:acyltransferase [Oscillospiraceae bacterium]